MKILLADDEPSIRLTLGDDLQRAGHAVTAAPTGSEARDLLGRDSFDALVADLRLPGVSGLDLLRTARARNPNIAVLVITGFGTVESAVEAMKAGADDYILKPFLNDEIVLVLKRLEEVRSLRVENRRLREALGERGTLKGLVGRSPRMQEVVELVRGVAPGGATVLIQGESGTGKERVAEALHALSPRAEGPLVKVSASVFPETLLEDELFGHEKGAFTDAKERKVGRFERAHGGTIFLDDVDDLSPGTQVKLLRVLQEREFERLGGTETVRVDIRVVAATKADLEDLVRAGGFREDLFYRLNVVPIVLPPLRERIEDVSELFAHFLEKHGRGRSFQADPDVLRFLSEYAWPGNVRELENAVERAIALAGDSNRLGADAFRRFLKAPAPPPAEPGNWRRPLAEVVAAAEKAHLAAVVDGVRGNKSAAAEVLGISRKNLWEKLKRHGI